MTRIGTPTNIGLLDQRYIRTTGDTMTGQLVLSLAGTGLSVTQDSVIGGYLRVGDTSAPTNTTAGDLTAIRLFTGTTQSEFSIDGSGNVAASGWGRFNGSYNENTTTTSVHIGNTSTPRILFANGTAAQNWQIDNNGGTFRWFLPGVVHFQLTSSGGGFRNYLRVGSTNAPNNTTAGDLTATRLSLGNNNSLFSGQVATINATMTNTTSGAVSFIGVGNSITPTANSSTEFRAIYFQNIVNPGTGITITSLRAGYFENRLQLDGTVFSAIGVIGQATVLDSGSPATVGTITAATAFDARVGGRPSGTSVVTVSTGIGLDTSNAGASGYTFTTFKHINITNVAATANTSQIGIDIGALSRGSTDNIGIRIAAPSGATNNYALQLSDTGGTSAGGLTFGSDVQLYRSAANVLSLDDTLALKAGSSSGTIAKVGGTIFDHYADVSNGTTVETDLYSDTIPASTLTSNGDKLIAEYVGTSASNGNTKTIKVYFGGTSIASFTIPTGSIDPWKVTVTIIRDSSTSVRAMVQELVTTFTNLSYATVTGLTLTNTNILKITGTGGASSDITATLGTVIYQPAA